MVAEPGELADKFLQSVKRGLLSVMQSRRRKAASLLANISTISDLVASKTYFQIGGIVHRYIGRQTQVCFSYYLLFFYFVSDWTFQNYNCLIFGVVFEGHGG